MQRENTGPTTTEQLVGEHGWRVTVHTRHHLDDWTKEYLDGLAVRREEDGTTRISGELPDMPAVYGMILRLRDGNITIISLHVERTGGSSWKSIDMEGQINA